MNLRSVMLVLLMSVVSLFSACGGGPGDPPAKPGMSSVASSSVSSSVASSSAVSSSVSSSIGSLSSSIQASSSSSSSLGVLLGGAIQGKALNLTNTVTTFAGVAPGANGVGAQARFQHPAGSVVVGANLFVADSGNYTIRKIVITSGVVTTFAGTAGTQGSVDGTGTAASFGYPYGITTDNTNLFVTDQDNHTIRKIVIATGVVTTLAGTAATSGNSDGTGAAARFNKPEGITTDSTNLFVADRGNHTIRKIVIATGMVTTLAGTAGTHGSSDGTGTSSSFNNPYGITTDSTSLFVTDMDNNTIRKIVIATGVVTTLAGTAGTSGNSDGAGEAARFAKPRGITTDNTNLFVADTFNHTIRKVIIATGVVSTLAGTAGTSGSSDGTSTAARFYDPFGITTDGTNLFVADTFNSTIRKIVIATGVVSTLAGSVNKSSDGTSAAAGFNSPIGITTDGTNLFVADYDNSTIRKIIIATGVVTTLAGTTQTSGSSDGAGAVASFNKPYGITTDGTNLFVTDVNNHTIRKIVIATGVVTTLAGTAGSSGSSDGTGSAARFNYPDSITTDGVNLFVADFGNNTIRKIVIDMGVVTTLAGTADFSGSSDGTGVAARFNGPAGVTTDGTNLFVTDTSNNSVRKIVIATGVVTTLAGSSTSGSSDGTGAAAGFSYPEGITTDGTNLFVTDYYNNTIRKIE